MAFYLKRWYLSLLLCPWMWSNKRDVQASHNEDLFIQLLIKLWTACYLNNNCTVVLYLVTSCKIKLQGSNEKDNMGKHIFNQTFLLLWTNWGTFSSTILFSIVKIIIWNARVLCTLNWNRWLTSKVWESILKLFCNSECNLHNIFFH